MWSVKTGGLSLLWSLKTGFTVLSSDKLVSVLVNVKLSYRAPCILSLKLMVEFTIDSHITILVINVKGIVWECFG